MFHSCFCQFCDKEIAAENLATLEQGYITCGNLNCIRRAKNTARELLTEELRKVEHKARMVVFSTKTPEVDDTWRIVEQKNHPEVLRNVEVMSFMKQGHFVYDEEEKTYYCTKTGFEVLNQIKEKQAGNPDHE